MPVPEYVPDKEVQDALNDVLTDTTYVEFNTLADLEVSIVTVVKVKTNNDGELVESQKDPIVVKKVPDLYSAFTEAHVLMVVDRYAWDHVLDSTKKRQAAIHRALMSIEAGMGEDGIKIKLVKPDIQEFTATVARFGAVTRSLEELQVVFQEGSDRFIEHLKSLATPDAAEESDEKAA